MLYSWFNLNGNAWDRAVDSVVAGSAVITTHTQILRSLRMFRLVRVARATRLLHSMPELGVLAQGMIQGVRSVLAVLCLLMLVIYVFAVTFTMTLSGTDGVSGVFDTVPQSMNFLLLQVLCGPDQAFISSLLAVHWAFYLLYLLFLLLAVLTLMNMLIGILCTVVANAAEMSKETTFLKEVETHTSRLAKALDSDGSGTISKDEFEILIKDPVMTTSFSDLGVDIVAVANFARFIYEQTDAISYANFALLVAKFRGTKSATVKDMMDVIHYLTVELLESAAFLPGTLSHL